MLPHWLHSTASVDLWKIRPGRCTRGALGPHTSVRPAQQDSLTERTPPGGLLGHGAHGLSQPASPWIKAILMDQSYSQRHMPSCDPGTAAPYNPLTNFSYMGYTQKACTNITCLPHPPQRFPNLTNLILESACRRIWSLPSSFPRAGLHAPQQEWGLNLPSLWEDYYASAVRTWTTTMNDKGALGLTARASLTASTTKFAQSPLELALTLNKRGSPLCTSLSAKCMAAVIMGDMHPIGGPHLGGQPHLMLPHQGHTHIPGRGRVPPPLTTVPKDRQCPPSTPPPPGPT